MEQERQWRLRSGIDDHRVAGRGEHDRLTGPASQHESLEHRADLVAIGT